MPCDQFMKHDYLATVMTWIFSISAVRFGRVPKREKAKILAAMQSSRLKTQESKVMADMSDDGKIIETIVRAHYDTCDYTRNKMEPFLQKARARSSFAVCTGTVSVDYTLHKRAHVSEISHTHAA